MKKVIEIPAPELELAIARHVRFHHGYQPGAITVGADAEGRPAARVEVEMPEPKEGEVTQ